MADVKYKNVQTLLKPFARVNAVPLDRDEIWESISAAEQYMNSPMAYAGQTIKVLLEDGKYQSYTIQPHEDGEKLVLEQSELEAFELKTYKIPFSSSHYKKDVSFVIEVLLNDGVKIYSVLETKNIFQLAKDARETNSVASKIYKYFEVSSLNIQVNLNLSEYSKTSTKYSFVYTNAGDVKNLVITLEKDFSFTSEFELKINDAVIERSKYLIKENVLTYKQSEKKVENITTSVDLLLKTYSTETEEYILTYANPSYDKITVIITLKDDFVFADNFVLNFNGKDIKAKDYKIEGNVLTYIFDDPNWTGIY